MHIHANESSKESSDHVEEGIDLTEYYINVEWDILRGPAERHVKVYACCPEPYPGKLKCTKEICQTNPIYFRHISI